MLQDDRVDLRFEFDDGMCKNLRNFESAENIQSSNIVEFECELRHIPSVKQHENKLCNAKMSQKQTSPHMLSLLL